MPVGALVSDGGVSFRVWAPQHTRVYAVVGDLGQTRRIELAPEGGSTAGYFAGLDPGGRPGDRYHYEIGNEEAPDPASRFQPEGVTGRSQVVDPRAYAWQCPEWKRPPWRGRVIYELHVGTFTPEGTFAGMISRLDALADLGVNTLELMPVADFPGGHNWGYDGVMLYAPARCYGTPDQLRALIDAAHARGLAVMLDVVYNHLGPCGNVLPRYSAQYFHPQHDTAWGTGLNFDGPGSAALRDFFLQNACMWLDEYRIDGLRLDAVHAIHDRSTPHIIAEIAAAAQARGAFVVAEDERNEARTVMPRDRGGWGVDAVWSDDFHHTMRVAVTGERESYFVNYTGTRDEWIETLRAGWLFRGQYFPTWQRSRGTAGAQLPPESFVVCTSNHDQVGNRPLGDRLSAVVAPEIYRAISMLGCLLPYTPLLFMGQEWAASAPFPFFSELPGDVGAAMRGHRIAEFARHGMMFPPAMLEKMPDPQADTTFRAAKLDWVERELPRHAGVLALYRASLRIRAAYPIFQSAPRGQWTIDKVGEGAVQIGWRDGAVRWALVVATTTGVALNAVEPGRWTRVLASNEARFGGDEAQIETGPGCVLWKNPGE